MGNGVASGILHVVPPESILPKRTLVYAITGATGTIGTALTRHLLNLGHKVRAIARGEAGHERLKAMLPPEQHERFSPLVGDVCDYDRMRRAFDGVDIVIHAAAMKRIPLCEYNPEQAVHTNVNGTVNVTRACLDADVLRALFISSDKARAPSTHYGSTKLAAERLWLASNFYCGPRPGKFVATAYGNVFGSQGSALHAFRAQAPTGTIKITDKACTRFSIRITQAVEFICRVIREAKPGELFVPKLPAYRVIDLAQAVAPKARQETIGLRAGEKIHELLVSEDESRFTIERDDHYVMTPGKTQGKGGWDYHSGRCTWRLSVEALRHELELYDKEQAACRMSS